MRLNALFRLAFAPAPLLRLTSPHTITRWLILQKARCHRTEVPLQRIVGTWFQVLFHSPPGVLFTFPSRYLSAIGHQGVFRLNGWSRQIHTEFQGFRVTWEHAPEPVPYVYGPITLYGTAFQPISTSTLVSYSVPHRQMRVSGPTTPRMQPLPGITRNRFGLIRFRSPLLSESLLFSLPTGTEMFHFPAFPPIPYVFRYG